MSDQLKIFFSNQLEVLFQNLKKTLFQPASPFKQRLIVVYGPAIKNWLMLKMAQDDDLQVSMGLEFVYLNDIFEKLLFNAGKIHSHLPSQLELALAIEQQILKMLCQFEHLEESEQNVWLPLIQYLKIESTPLLELSRKAERRLIGLSQQIARCFKEYGRYRNGLIPEWESDSSSEWQQRLWLSLFSEKNGWTYPCKAFQQPVKVPDNCEIHFFSISFLSQIEFQFLNRISNEIPISYYLLSPCAMFWSDIRSDRESAYLQSFWHKKLGEDSSQVHALDEFLRDRNPLLANFGRLGREMVTQIEESQAQTYARYLLPNDMQQLDDEFFLHEDLEFKESQHPLTLLHAMQADILLMRNPQGKGIRVIEPEDLSLQLHIAPTRRREVQILYHNLLRLIEKKSLSPADMIVMAPDIMEYVPYIQSIFGATNSQIDFQILDLGMQAQSELIKGFLQLLTLSESRWNAIELLQLFEHRSFQRRHQLTTADYELIQHWIEKTGIRWGATWQHRNELLERRHCQQEIVEETNMGTWEHGISRLLMGLTTIVEGRSIDFDPLPYANIDFSQAELLGKWIRILRALRDDLTPLHDQSHMTMEDWVNYLHCLLESYFQPDIDDSQSMEEYADLKAQFEILRNAVKLDKGHLFAFQSVKTHLQTLLEHRGMIYRENCLQSVRFCSMIPLRSIPSKVIAILGMQEGDFPRSNQHSSLNLLHGRHDADYCPTAIDYDRYLFLEAMHSAQDYLLLSYQGYCHTDGKELQPSLLVEELFSYFDKYYLIGDQKPSKYCTYHHPFDSFNEAYFQKGSRLSNFSMQDFKAAQAFYGEQKNDPHCFVLDFNKIDHPQVEVIPNRSIIDVKHLMAVARNPIKFHLNHVLEIYLQGEEDRQIKTEEELVVSALDKYQIKHAALNESLDDLLIRAEKEGKLPSGLFKTVATNRLKEEVKELKKQLKKHGIEEEEIFTIELVPGCLYPTQVDSTKWLFPPLRLSYDDGYEIFVTGKLPYVTSKGLLSISKGTLADAWKSWPQFLVFLCAIKSQPTFEKQLIFAQASKSKSSFMDHPESYLKQFINYYALCIKNFSPLIPDWIPSILEGNVKALQDKMNQSFSTSFGNEYQSQDLRWILNKERLPNPDEMIHDWKNQAENLLKDLIHHWYPKEKHEEV